jgi:ATP-binding cassette, subfamily C, bacterial
LNKKITFRSLWGSLLAQKEAFWYANLFGILSTVAFLPVPMLIPLLIDDVLLQHPGKLTAVFGTFFKTDEPWIIIAGTLLTVLVLRGVVFVLNNAKTFHTIRIVQKSAYLLRKELLHHLERLALSEYEALKSGTPVAKSIHDVENVSAFLGEAATAALTAGLTFFGILAVMFYISWPLALLVIILNPLFLGVSRIIGRKAGQLLRRQFEAYEAYMDMLGEILELFVQVRASNQEHAFFGMLKAKAGMIRDTSMEYGYRSSVAQSSSVLLTKTVVDVFRALGIAFVAYSDLSIGMMLAFLFYLTAIAAPVQQLLGLAVTFHSVKPSMERLNSCMRMAHEPIYPHRENPFEGVTTTSAELKNVSFAFTDDKSVLKDVSLRAESGKKTALIGPSGSGKTTIAQLLVGFYPPQSGTIAFDGVPIERIGLPVVRENVALMLQDSLFFNDTIRMNLTLGKAVDDTTLFDALRAAQLEDFVRGLTDGLDTLIGKNGIRLSGGQRQRLAIARLILSDPKIVIFDEATSALDNETELRLYESLAPFLKKRTTIIIAHRTTTIRQADYIYLVSKAEVLSEGTFEELNQQGLIKERF